MMSGMAGMVAQGMAFGTGSAIAHQAVGAIAGSMGGGSSSSEEAPAQHAAPAAQQVSAPPGPCGANQQDLYKCLHEQNGNASACQYFFDALTQCQQNASYQQQLQ